MEGETILTIEFETEPTGVVAELLPFVGEEGSIEVDNAFYVEDGEWLESFTVAAAAEIDLEARFGSIPGVSVFYAQSLPSGSTGMHLSRAVVFANEPYPYVLETVLRRHAIPNRLVVEPGTVTVIATVEEWDDFRDLADDIEAKYGRFDLLKVNETDRPGEPLDSGRLTDVLVSKFRNDQIDVLETAYTMGYFAVPREASAQEVAEALGIQQSTFSERIRTAQHTLFELIFSTR